jgi:hypothetical protein
MRINQSYRLGLSQACLVKLKELAMHGVLHADSISRAKHFALGLLLFSLVHCGSRGPNASTPSESGSSDNSVNKVSVIRLDATPNPTGLQLGFWEVYSQQAATLQYLGKRPTSRVGFDDWASFELSKGVYTFPAAAANVIRVHNYGETAFVSVNISFTNQITPEKQTIPAFYNKNYGSTGPDTNRITDPITRQAAKDFLRAYVRWMLGQVGGMVLTIDYEIMSNYRLYASDSKARAAEWGAWYVEAVGVAREAAASLGKQDQLKLMPIVNGDPFSTGNPILEGPTNNAWLVDVVTASDYLALDTYFSNRHSDDPSDPENTIDTIEFWISQYGTAKDGQKRDVIVTENGFTTITTFDKTITREKRDYKYTGTEREQASYYSKLFPRLLKENQITGRFQNRLRSFNIWGITDNAQNAIGDTYRYFGLLRIDGPPDDLVKPAMPVVQAAFARAESDAFHRPYTISTTGIDVTSDLINGTGSVPVTYSRGDQFQVLRYTESKLPAATRYTLQIDTALVGNVVVCVNHDKWLYAEGSKNHGLDLTPYLTAGSNPVIEVYFTSAIFPFQQRVQKLALLRT